MTEFKPSPFLDPGVTSADDTLGIIHLKRDLLVATHLHNPSSTDTDYAEGKVSNTRFGSFPHTTLIGVPWGSQIRASKVDTGSRGNKDRKGTKRKRQEGPVEDGEESRNEQHKTAVAASTGFAHLLPPTPESWTISLPHRTQVVYTPDYSYILQRLRVRPGDTIIEAGAGSGSFSHAAARAVFNGYPHEFEAAENIVAEHIVAGRRKKSRRQGRVYSFEYHEPRAQKLIQEIKEHRLDPIVTVTHRDVYENGFCVSHTTIPDTEADTEPQADAVFLDLPAPWLALKHLSRKAHPTPASSPQPGESEPFTSPLNPRSTTRICTFSPCIEQVTKTVATLRDYGWTEIDMVEIQHKRIDVRRERIGFNTEGLRGAIPAPASVEEAITRLQELEERHKAHRQTMKEDAAAAKSATKIASNGVEPKNGDGKGKQKENTQNKPEPNKNLFKEGRIVHRTEVELKTHTSYLVFAILPIEWTEEDEQRCKKRWPTSSNGKETS